MSVISNIFSNSFFNEKSKERKYKMTEKKPSWSCYSVHDSFLQKFIL